MEDGNKMNWNCGRKTIEKRREEVHSETRY